VLSLLAKPALVTLPFALLLLDYWPLGRMADPFPAGRARGSAPGEGAHPQPGLRRLAAEKIPWLIIAIAFTVLASYSIGALQPLNDHASVPLLLRFENALVSYTTYLAKLIAPTGLAVFYPYPLSVPLWKTALAGTVLGAVSLVFFRWRVERPYLLTGWLWFLGTLVPALGIVQAGMWPAWADRWAYVPSIGIFVIAAWGGRDLIHRLGAGGRAMAGVAALAGIALLSCAAHRQAAVWQNDFALYQNAISRVEGNYFAYNCLAAAYHRMQRFEEAEGMFAKALEIAPWFVPAHIGIAKTHHESGNITKAFHHLKEALRLSPYEKNAYNNLGVLYLQCDEIEKAREAFETALAIDDGFSEAHNNLGFIYLRTGRLREARDHLGRALALDPGNPMAAENMQELSALINRR
jgi:tetratricopeptide (TPR) repeat protein